MWNKVNIRENDSFSEDVVYCEDGFVDIFVFYVILINELVFYDFLLVFRIKEKYNFL